MSKFTMTVNLDNDYWRVADDIDYEIVAAMLEDAAVEVRNQTTYEVIMDGNGNSCGSWTINNNEGDE